MILPSELEADDMHWIFVPGVSCRIFIDWFLQEFFPFVTCYFPILVTFGDCRREFFLQAARKFAGSLNRGWYLQFAWVALSYTNQNDRNTSWSRGPALPRSFFLPWLRMRRCGLAGDPMGVTCSLFESAGLARNGTGSVTQWGI